MSLPFYIYAAGIFLLSVTLMKLMTTGQQTIACALLMLILTHRMLSLTYFNLLLIGGFRLLALSAFGLRGHSIQTGNVTPPKPSHIN